MTRSRLRMLRGTEGAEIVELAFVLPLMFMILLGIFWFARALQIHATVTRAAQEAVRVAATSNCATCSPQSLAAQASAIDQSVAAILRASGLQPSQVTPYTSGSPSFCTTGGVSGACTTTTGNVRVCRGVVLNPTAAGNPVNEQCGVTVGLQYPLQFSLPTVTSSPPFLTRQPYGLSLKAQVQTRVDYSCWQGPGC